MGKIKRKEKSFAINGWFVTHKTDGCWLKNIYFHRCSLTKKQAYYKIIVKA